MGEQMSRTVTVAGRTAGGGEGSSASGASKSHLSEREARSLRGIGVGGRGTSLPQEMEFGRQVRNHNKC